MHHNTVSHHNHEHALGFRANIESSHGHQISNLRMQYTQEDKEVIEEFLKAKREFSLKSETHVKREGLFGNNRLSLSLSLFPSLSFSLPFMFVY